MTSRIGESLRIEECLCVWELTEADTALAMLEEMEDVFVS